MTIRSALPTTIMKVGVIAGAVLVTASSAIAQKTYDPGITDTEIKIGQSAVYSGPMSSINAWPKTEAGYFKMINEAGGINGRKVNFISLDDGFQPARAVENVRKLVEDEKVFAIAAFGTSPSAAVQQYLNDRKVPQLFVSSGANRFSEPAKFPWTIGWTPTYQAEGSIFARYILQQDKTPKIAILYQNDDYGKAYVEGFKKALGAQTGGLIVKEVSHEISDPSVDSQIISLQNSGANFLFSATSPKFAAQAIRKMHDLGWKPTHMLVHPSTSVKQVLSVAGLDKATGTISSRYFKDPSDPTWANDNDVKKYTEFMKKYASDVDPSDPNAIPGYMRVQTIVHVLRQLGNDLTRENLMKHARNLKSVEISMLIPGIQLNTSERRVVPINQLQLMKFDGKTWKGFGEVLSDM